MYQLVCITEIEIVEQLFLYGSYNSLYYCSFHTTVGIVMINFILFHYFLKCLL